MSVCDNSKNPLLEVVETSGLSMDVSLIFGCNYTILVFFYFNFYVFFFFNFFGFLEPAYCGYLGSKEGEGPPPPAEKGKCVKLYIKAKQYMIMKNKLLDKIPIKSFAASKCMSPYFMNYSAI